MPYQGLAEFLECLGQQGQLARVAVPVDPRLEIAEITARAVKAGGPALVFADVSGHPFPAVTNLFGTPGRLSAALGVATLADAAGVIAGLVASAEPEGWFEQIVSGGTRAKLRKLAPKTVRTGACQQIVALGTDVDLGELPVLRCWPEETAGSITAARVFTRAPGSNARPVGCYPLRVLDRNRLAACWPPHDEPARTAAGCRDQGQPMPVAAVLGGDPSGLLAALAPLPENVDPLCLAGLWRGKPVEMVKCKTVDLEVPADAEWVIEGLIDPAEPAVETGWYGLPNGFYGAAGPVPVVRVTAVTRRANAVYPAIVPGPPPDEQCAITGGLGQVFLPLLQAQIPELADYHLPEFGAARHWAFASIRKSYAGQARKVVHALWGLRPSMWAKMLVVVDDSVEIRDSDQVWRAVSSHVDPAADVWLDSGPRDPWDPAAPGGSLAARLAWDATAKLPGECRGPRPPRTVRPEEIAQQVGRRWTEYGLKF
jgi:4-hydroxy-3-polyprenylbenzoate decarboxylase